LFADDDILVSMGAADMLTDAGNSVTEAQSGAPALQLLQSDAAFDGWSPTTPCPICMLRCRFENPAIRPLLPIVLAIGYAEMPHSAAIGLRRLAKPYRRNLRQQSKAPWLPGAVTWHGDEPPRERVPRSYRVRSPGQSPLKLPPITQSDITCE
jgi:hypothetical protein